MTKSWSCFMLALVLASSASIAFQSPLPKQAHLGKPSLYFGAEQPVSASVEPPYLVHRFEGELTGDDEQGTVGVVDRFELPISRGEVVSILAESTVLAPYLTAEFDRLNLIDTWHRGDRGSAFIEFRASRDGPLHIQITSLGKPTVGAYRLTVRRRQSEQWFSPEDVQPISPGDTIDGAINDWDAQSPSNEPTDLYALAASAGHYYTIRMREPSGDPLTRLSLYRPGWPSIGTSQGSVGGESVLSFQATTSGTVTIAAGFTRRWDRGGYSLAVEHAETAPEGYREPVLGQNGRVFGVFVGISNYLLDKAGIYEPTSRSSDARTAYHWCLQQLGMLDAHGVLLVDADATRHRLDSALADFGARMGHEDILVMFFAGRGGRLGRTTLERADPDMTDETLVLYDNWDLTDNDLDEMLLSVPRGRVLIVLDSSYSGGFAKDVLSRPGRMGIFASPEDTSVAQHKASVDDARRLTRVFIDAIGPSARMVDANIDGRIDAHEFCEFMDVSSGQDRERSQRVYLDGSEVEPHRIRIRILGNGESRIIWERSSISPSEVLFVLPS